MFSYPGDILNIPQLRDDVAYFDCSAEALSLCLNPASYYISSITGFEHKPVLTTWSIFYI